MPASCARTTPSLAGLPRSSSSIGHKAINALRGMGSVQYFDNNVFMCSVVAKILSPGLWT